MPQPKTPGVQRVHIGCRLDPELADFITDLAVERGESKSQVIASVLGKFRDNHQRKAKA